ncbi:MAG: hypothetical protein K8I27_05100 [Planctomycetes bacterium]|nr:hypothetical protein [Planctomycetota bacterium]
MNKPGNAPSDRQARRRNLEAELTRLGRRRNRIGGAGAGGGTVIVLGIVALRRYFQSPGEAMANPLVIAAAVGLASCVIGVIALGSYVVRLNTRIEQVSAELMMLEVRG